MSEWKWCCATWRRVLPCRSGRFRSAVLPWSAPPHLSTPHLHSTAKSEREATAALADSHLFGPHSGPHRLGPGGRRGVWRAERNSAAAPLYRNARVHTIALGATPPARRFLQQLR